MSLNEYDPLETAQKTKRQCLPFNISPLTYLTEYRVVFCVDCRSVIVLDRLQRHIAHAHKYICASTRRMILEDFSKLDAAKTVDQVKPRPDGSPPLAYLDPPVIGYSCPFCTTLRTKSWDRLRKHMTASHKRYGNRIQKEDVTCHLQQWITKPGLGSGRYWKVDVKKLKETCGLDVRRIENAKVEDEAGRILRLEQEEEDRVIGELFAEKVALDHELEYDEKSDWLQGSGWPDWFAHKPLSLLTAAATIPTHDIFGTLYLGNWNGIECVSSATCEQVLRAILSALDAALLRCEETARQTSRVFRCWLRSWSHSYFPHPFELRTQSTRRSYKQIWARFFCYVFRMRRLGLEIKERPELLSGLYLTSSQKAVMDRIWTSISAWLARTDKNQKADRDVPTSIIELVFELCVAFWTESSANGLDDKSAIAHFSGVLGIHPRELVFRKAYRYTTFLSALIWVGRLVMLEYALPLRAYTHLAPPLPGRTSYPDQFKRLCDQIRPSHLLRGSMSPMSYLIERLQHGRAIAKREGPPTNISWSPDGQTLEIAGNSITVQQFRTTIHDVITRTQQLTQDLLFDWWPEIELGSVKDDMSIHKPGYSFLTEPANRLQSSFRELSKRAFSKGSKGGAFSLAGHGRVSVLKYLQLRDKLMRHLFAAIHLTSGMPARGQELRAIRWANTIAAPRNVFVYKGRLILVFAYNKANTNCNNSFYVVRSPCLTVQRIIYIYLVYIRPFCEFLSRQLQIITEPTTNLHVFTQHDMGAGNISLSACLKSIREATSECPMRLSLQIYRQIAISMSKKHIPALIQNFDPNTPKDFDGFLHLLAFQTGHKPATRTGTYALERAYPARLQPDLIDRYIENSLIWHTFTLTGVDDYIQISVDCDFSMRQDEESDPKHLSTRKASIQPSIEEWETDVSEELADQNMVSRVIPEFP